MNINWKGVAGAAVAAVFVCGCYNYKAPAVSTLQDTYSERKKDAADDIFKDIKVLTLLDAQRIAIRNNPTYIAAYHAVEAARMRYYQAWGAYSPTLKASYELSGGHSWTRDAETYQHRRDTFGNGFGVSANLLLFDGFSRYFSLKSAKSSLKYQELMEEDACRTMMLSVAYAYNTVLLAIEQRRIAMEDRKFQLDSLQNTQYKFEAGAAPLSDVLNFEILVNNAEVKMIDADYSYDTALYALAVLMGYPDGTLPADLKFSADYKSYFAELPAVEIYLDAALANRPDLKAYREKLNIAKYNVYKAWGAFSPTVNAYAAYTADLNNVDNGTFLGSTYSEGHVLSYGINVDWTVFNGAVRYNKLREAQASMAAADFDVAAQWFQVVDEVRTAYANYIQNVKKTKLYGRVRELSAKQRDLVDDEYRAGNAELTRLNEAQRDLVSAETSLASSFINVQNAKALLDSVVGGNTAEYYLNDADKSKQERFPGLGNLPDAIKTAESESAAPAAPATPAAAPAKKSAAPVIPASAKAAPAK